MESLNAIIWNAEDFLLDEENVDKEISGDIDYYCIVNSCNDNTIFCADRVYRMLCCPNY